jgi:hypothetical protein
MKKIKGGEKLSQKQIKELKKRHDTAQQRQHTGSRACPEHKRQGYRLHA